MFFPTQRLRCHFLRRILLERIFRRDCSCPYCDSSRSILLERKHLILDLRRCASCGLQFRWPKDSVQRNSQFYQNAYREGLTTNLPDQESLRTMKDSLFQNTEKDFGKRIELLKSLVPEGRVLDYGCSWGYGSYQLSANGYETVGFEISLLRAEFARTHLGIQTVTNLNDLEKMEAAFEAIFASHVLEHLPSLTGVFERFRRLLKPGGLLLIFVPNCGGLNAIKYGVNWGPMCCEKHTIAFDASFFLQNLPKYGFQVVAFSDPYPLKTIGHSAIEQMTKQYCQGDELVIRASLETKLIARDRPAEIKLATVRSE